MFRLGARGTSPCYKVLLMTLFKKKNNGGDDVGERVFIVACSLVLIFSIFYIKYSEISEYFNMILYYMQKENYN